MPKSFEELYGGKGIDTPYEREIFTYRPDLSYTKEYLRQLLPQELQQSIERSRTFMISQNLMDYDELIWDIEEMLKELENRNPEEKISRLNEILKKRDLNEIIQFEKEHSGYHQTGDYELYVMLSFMCESLKKQRDYLDEKFRTQITSETDIEKIQEAEEELIQEWEYLEAQTLEAYKHLHEMDEDDVIFNESFMPSDPDLAYQQIEIMEKKKRQKEIFHTSLADTAYVHRNRYFMFLQVVEKAKVLVYQPECLIRDGIRDFIFALESLNDIESAKIHLILSFREVRKEHDALKRRFITIDDDKEAFASEKNLFYQQLETKTVEPIKTWLYEQDENKSRALDRFARYMVSSLKATRTNYEGILADLLNFYRSEANFYDKEIHYLREKEEIRRFYRILEDLEGLDKIHPSWVDEYLKSNGYEP